MKYVVCVYRLWSCSACMDGSTRNGGSRESTTILYSGVSWSKLYSLSCSLVAIGTPIVDSLTCNYSSSGFIH